MKKYAISSLLIILLFVIGCAPSDLPPEPGAPGAPVGEATAAMEEGYAPPYNIFENNQMIFITPGTISATSGQDKVQVRLAATLDGGFIYNRGYIYTAQGWQEYTFYTKTVGGSNWIRDSADADLSIPVADLSEGENYVLAYTCKKYDGVWKCGCRSENDCGYWMLQTFTLEKAGLECTDTDGGKEYYVKGTAKGLENGQLATSTDGCRYDDVTLAEVYCDGSELKVTQYVCDFICEDGACVKAPPEPTPISAAGPLVINKVWLEKDPLNPGYYVLYSEILNSDGSPAKMSQGVNVFYKISYQGDMPGISDTYRIGHNSQNSEYRDKYYWGAGFAACGVYIYTVVAERDGREVSVQGDFTIPCEAEKCDPGWVCTISAGEEIRINETAVVTTGGETKLAAQYIREDCSIGEEVICPGECEAGLCFKRRDSYILEEGQSEVYIVGGRDYKVTVSYIGTEEVKFTLDGELSKSLRAGETYTFNTEPVTIEVVQIKNVVMAGERDAVEFVLTPETVSYELIEIKPVGGTKYELDFSDADGNKVRSPFAYLEETGTTRLGDSNNDLSVDETAPLKDNDYFILTGQEGSWVMQYKGTDPPEYTTRMVKLKNLATAESLEREYTPQAGTTHDAELVLRDQIFRIWNAGDDTAADFDIQVDMDSSGALDNPSTLVYLKSGAKIKLTDAGLTLIEEDGNEIIMNLVAEPGNVLNLKRPVVTIGPLLDLSEGDIYTAKTPYGTIVEYSGLFQYTVSINYPIK
ncbi:hypothetical protein KY345_03700 [Candidatus Woesearchaeota archaeon]|nr:hypothetical protein [Candidatus Woesearchaeota archaeon]